MSLASGPRTIGQARSAGERLGVAMAGEPTTALSDFFLGSVGVYWALQLWAFSHAKHIWPAAAMALAIAASSTSAFAGVVVHGLGPRLSKRWHDVLWRSALVAACLANYFFVAAVQKSALPSEWGSAGTLLADANLARTVFAICWLLRWPVYRLVWLDSALSLAAAMALLLVVRPIDAVWSAPLSKGVGLAFAAALAQRTGWRRGQPWNHNDVYHLLQLGALYFFYQAGLGLFDR